MSYSLAFQFHVFIFVSTPAYSMVFSSDHDAAVTAALKFNEYYGLNCVSLLPTNPYTEALTCYVIVFG